MNTIRIEHHPDAERLKTLDVDRWPIWTKEVSEFPWSYDECETCLILEGEVTVTWDGGFPLIGLPGNLRKAPNTWVKPRRLQLHFGIEF